MQYRLSCIFKILCYYSLKIIKTAASYKNYALYASICLKIKHTAHTRHT